jgi:hypothetical protein
MNQESTKPSISGEASGDKNPPCPLCGGKSARLVYGLFFYGTDDMPPALLNELRSGEARLGGCVVGPELWHCNSCDHRWR